MRLSQIDVISVFEKSENYCHAPSYVAAEHSIVYLFLSSSTLHGTNRKDNVCILFAIETLARIQSIYFVSKAHNLTCT